MLKIIASSIMQQLANNFLIPDSNKSYIFQKLAWRHSIGRVILSFIFFSIPTQSLVRNGETALFGGMWRTETLVNWSNVLGPDGYLIIAEADKQNAKILEIEAERRKLRNVKIINKALYHSNCQMKLQTSSISARNKLKNISTYSPRNPEENYERDETVTADTVDNILNQNGIKVLHHLHLTVSGAEKEVLEGAQKTIERGQTRIFTRSILLRRDTNEPNLYSVEKFLKNNSMYTIKSMKEPNRDNGCNIYAVPRSLFHK